MSEVFEGNELETGVLQRVRRWRDAIPALVLVDALRVAGSPLSIGLVWVTLGVHRWLMGWGQPADIAWLPAGFSDPALGFGWITSLTPFPDGAAGGGLAAATSAGGWATALGYARLVVLGLLWLVPIAILARAGACYAAGRPQPLSWHLGGVLRRYGKLVEAVLLPIVAVAICLLGIVALGGVGRLADVPWLGWVGGLVTLAAVPLAVFAGLLIAFSIVAVPLAIVAVVLEKQPDAVDSLSRGYEYSTRRLAHLAGYSLLAGILVGLVLFVGSWLAIAAAWAGGWGLRFGSGSDSLAAGLASCLALLPSAMAITALWGQIGAIYLLMRQAANDQEIEDIAVTAYDMRPDGLPSLQVPEAASADAP